MKIRALRTITDAGFALRRGKTAPNVPDHLAALWIARGWAEEVAAPSVTPAADEGDGARP